MLVVIATTRPETLAGFIRALSRRAEAVAVPSGEDALKAARERAPLLTIVDQDLPDFLPFDLITALVRANPLGHTALLTTLSAEELHEQGEGLGILAGLPLCPDPAEAEALLARAERLS